MYCLDEAFEFPLSTLQKCEKLCRIFWKLERPFGALSVYVEHQYSVSDRWFDLSIHLKGLRQYQRPALSFAARGELGYWNNQLIKHVSEES